MARLASQDGDDGTNDLLVSSDWANCRAWFVADHVVDTPAVRVDAEP
jgi:hypothetical protein